MHRKYDAKTVTEPTKEFQFPSNGKVHRKLAVEVRTTQGFWFQFPSNGKAYPKATIALTLHNTTTVSIPFQRESVSKVWTCQKAQDVYDSFNSLQTGKRIQSTNTFMCRRQRKRSFNSLQTGRRIQRVEYKIEVYASEKRGFNSLQTGRRIQRRSAP